MKSTEWIQWSFVMNAMVSLCCNSLEAHERWLQKLYRLFSLRCQDQGEIVSFVSFREIDCRSAQTTASQHHSCKTLHFVSSPPQMIYRSVPAHLLRADPATNELFGLLSANLSIKQHLPTRLTLCFRLLVILLSSDLHHLVVADHLGLVDHLGVVHQQERQDKIKSLAVSKAN